MSRETRDDWEALKKDYIIPQYSDQTHQAAADRWQKEYEARLAAAASRGSSGGGSSRPSYRPSSVNPSYNPGGSSSSQNRPSGPRMSDSEFNRAVTAMNNFVRGGDKSAATQYMDAVAGKMNQSQLNQILSMMGGL